MLDFLKDEILRAYQKYRELFIKFYRGKVIKYLFQQLLRLVAMLTHASSICFKTFVESFFRIIIDYKKHDFGYSTQYNDYGPFD